MTEYRCFNLQLLFDEEDWLEAEIESVLHEEYDNEKRYEIDKALGEHVI